MTKLNLTVLKAFLTDLEKNQEDAESKFNEDAEGLQVDFLVGLSKSVGLLNSLAQEAALLAGDLNRVIKNNSTPKPTKEEMRKMMAKMYGFDAPTVIYDEEDGSDDKGFGGGFNN